MAIGGDRRVEVLISARDEASAKMRSVAKSAEAMAADIGKVGRQMTLMGAAMLGAIGGTAMKMGEFASDITKMAKQTGTSTEDFQRLKFAVEQNEGSVENLVMGMTKLRKIMVDASQGSKAAQDTFARLGIAYRNSDGSIRSVNSVLLDLADVIAKSPDDIETMSEALEALGLRGGRELVPLLRQGRAEIEKTMAATPKIVSDEALNKLKDFNDRIDAVKTQLMATLAEGIQPLLPYLDRFIKFITDLISRFDAINPRVKETVARLGLFTGAVMLLIGGPLVVLSGALSMVGGALKVLAMLPIGRLVALLGSGGLATAFRTLSTGALAAAKPLLLAVGMLEAGVRLAGSISVLAGKTIQGIGGALGKGDWQKFGAELEKVGKSQLVEGAVIPALREIGKVLNGALAQAAIPVEVSTRAQAAIPVEVSTRAQTAAGVNLGGLTTTKGAIETDAVLAERRRLHLEIFRLTHSELAYKLEALRVEREAYRKTWKDNADLLIQYEKAYQLKVAEIKRDAREKEKSSAAKELNTLTGSRFGIEGYMPALMSVSGAFRGSFRQVGDAMTFTVRRVEDLAAKMTAMFTAPAAPAFPMPALPGFGMTPEMIPQPFRPSFMPSGQVSGGGGRGGVQIILNLDDWRKAGSTIDAYLRRTI